MLTVTTATRPSRENFGGVRAQRSVSRVTSSLHSFKKALLATCAALSAASMIWHVSGGRGMIEISLTLHALGTTGDERRIESTRNEEWAYHHILPFCEEH